MTQRDKAVSECLADAGCDHETIEQFLQLESEGKTAEGLGLLSKHRRGLLDTIHQDQKRLDVLDYLIYSIKKEQAE